MSRGDFVNQWSNYVEDVFMYNCNVIVLLQRAARIFLT